ncbi:MAG: 50S ribosomal protein L28 [Acidobacteriota bacterium]
MSRVCEICGKKPQFGHSISHAHNVTRKIWHPNLKSVRIIENGTVRRAKICTRCLRSGRVVKAIS